MVLGKMIAFSVGKGMTQNERTKFTRHFFGYTDKSNYKKYSYYREGWLDKFPHIKPIKSLIIMRKEDSERTIEYLRKFDAELFVRDVVLSKEDEVTLGIKEE